MRQKQIWIGLIVVLSAFLLTLRARAGDDGKGLFDFGRDGDTTRPTTKPAEHAPPATQPADNKKTALPSGPPVIIHLEATIDGSDVVTINRHGAHWVHKTWDWPQDVRINNVDWDPQDRPDLPSKGVLRMLPDLDFSTARVLNRSGRDTVAMEHTDEGIDIYFDDAPTGQDHYTIRIQIQREKANAE